MRAKIGLAHKGKPKLSGEKHGMWGKTHTPEARKRISESHIGLLMGDKNHNWKGGITPELVQIRHSFEMKNWRKAVFERDNYTCLDCGEKGGKLNADHILPFSLYPESRFDITNGRTLCIDCHRKTNTYGFKLKYEYLRR